MKAETAVGQEINMFISKTSWINLHLQALGFLTGEEKIIQGIIKGTMSPSSL